MGAKGRVLKEFDLTVAQYAALLGLKLAPGVSGATLARQCLVTPQAMTSVLKGLTSRGLVRRERHPVHAHVIELTLTDDGADLIATADVRVSAVERRIAEVLTDRERAVLRGSLEKVAAELDRF